MPKTRSTPIIKGYVERSAVDDGHVTLVAALAGPLYDWESHRTIGRCVRRRLAIAVSSRLRWPITRSGGVRAIHWFNETSSNLGRLKTLITRTVAEPMFSM